MALPVAQQEQDGAGPADRGPFRKAAVHTLAGAAAMRLALLLLLPTPAAAAARAAARAVTRDVRARRMVYIV
jgi:hypothetical protein